MEVDVVEQGRSAPTQCPASTGRRRGRRGRISRQKRVDAYRRVQNQVTIAAHRDAVRARLSGLDTITDMFSKFNLNKQPYAVPLPITTRGVGFASAMTYSSLCTLDSRIAEVQCDVHTVYRVALAQQAVQMCVSHRTPIRHLPIPTCVEYSDASLPVDFCSRFATVTETFLPLLAPVASIGNFEFDGTAFVPMLVKPKYPKEWCASVDLDITPVMEDDESEDPLPRRRRRRLPLVVDNEFLPDPFTTTIQNLRLTVRALSSPRTPSMVRQYYRRWCPIPGASWSDEDVLLNADVICPPKYLRTPDMWRRDTLRFNALVQAASKRFGYLVAPIVLDGLGDRRSLVSFQPLEERNIVINVTGVEVTFPSQCTFSAVRDLQPAELMTGAVALLGEKPPVHLGEGYGLRERDAQVVCQVLDWLTLVDAMFAKTKL